MNTWLQWFRRLTFVGIAANLGFIPHSTKRHSCQLTAQGVRD